MPNERPPLDTALKDRALDAASEGFTIVDLRRPGSPLIYVNEGFERLTGYSAAEVLGTNCRFLQGEGTAHETRAEITRAIAERRACVVEILNYRKDGTPFWNRLSLTPVYDASDVASHFIGVQSDVTDRRQAEDALRAANRELRVVNERTRRGLEAAAHIQRSLLPSDLPDVPGARFAWGFRPSDQLAGDVLGIVPLGPHQVGLYVIDVAGHGVPAALLSVTLSHWLEPTRGRSPLVTPNPDTPDEPWITAPALVAERLSEQFPFDTRTAQYFTMLYGVLDTQARTLRFVAAGHPSPLHLPRLGPASYAEATGFPIGLVPEPHYEESLLHLAPGDRVFLYSDGLVDGEDESGADLGRDGLRHEVEAVRGQDLERAVPALLESVARRLGSAGQRDDLTLLAVELF